MTPNRAQELLNHMTTMETPRGHKWTMRTIECGNIRKHMTEGEDAEVRAVWRTMAGHTCYADALRRIATTPSVELTPEGEQFVLPGAERQQMTDDKPQGSLWQ